VSGANRGRCAQANDEKSNDGIPLNLVSWRHQQLVDMIVEGWDGRDSLSERLKHLCLVCLANMLGRFSQLAF
jgi:hypothetical protein